MDTENFLAIKSSGVDFQHTQDAGSYYTPEIEQFAPEKWPSQKGRRVERLPTIRS